MRAVVALLCTSLVAMTGLAATPKPAMKAADNIIYLSTWPHTVRMVDIDQGKVVGEIPLSSDVARTLILTPDKKSLYAQSLRDNCIVTVDLEARKETDKFCLNTDTVTNRIGGLTLDPTGKFLYAILVVITKQLDHYEVSYPKLAMIDIAEKKIARAVDYPKDLDKPGFREQMRVSPDGKSLYLIRQSVLVFNTSDLKFSKKIELSNPIAPPGMDNLSLNLMNDPNEPKGKLIGVFTASDPYVHREVFGIGEIDLSSQTYEWTPVGPAAASMEPLLLTPDRSLGYTVAVTGTHGDRITEFWVFDMKTRKIVNKKPFLGRTRLNFGMTADGKYLLIYNAGFEVEVYDSKTLSLLNTISLGGDNTSNLLVMPRGE